VDVWADPLCLDSHLVVHPSFKLVFSHVKNKNWKYILRCIRIALNGWDFELINIKAFEWLYFIRVNDIGVMMFWRFVLRVASYMLPIGYSVVVCIYTRSNSFIIN